MTNIAVKELAYFSCGSGNLTTEFFSNHDFKEGSRAHDFLQSHYDKKSKAEVYIKHEFEVNNTKYLLHGFIDGVLNIDDVIVIEEIKSTTSDLDFIDLDFHKEHLAQAKIYAYLYALQNDMKFINVRLTYISIIDYETKSFNLEFSLDELETFTLDALEEYIKFQDLLDQAKIERKKTIDEIKFPFESLREGQRDLMKSCYKTMKDEGILYAIAPTGIGKTMATMFSALKSLDDNDKLFYVTAKGSGKNAPLDAIKILQKKGLKLKAIDITAKKKACNNKSKNCNPDECPFAIGYFDRLKNATKEIFENYDIFDYETINHISDKHKICSFEFSLYLSYFCDLVIADYNYVFDPHAHLIRYFDDDTYKPKVLVDEAHNLIQRGKEMYSASISSSDIRLLRSKMNNLSPSVRKNANLVIEKIESYREYLTENTLYVETTLNIGLNQALNQLFLKIDEILEENKKTKINEKDSILEIYFKILDFINVTECFGETHRLIATISNDNVTISLECLDASKLLLDTIKTSIHGIVLFSATLYPIEYHANLITCGEGKYLELPSPFDPNNLDIIINNSISTKYKNREGSIDSIIETIEILTSSHEGNYIVFFPSYQYLNIVKDKLNDVDFELIVQDSQMNDKDRNEIIDKFKNTKNTKVGLFVMGGVFSEGIDYIGDALSGVIIVGVGLPLVCDSNNILKDYFEIKYQKGFDYAYKYPGFTKVIQAVGRVIRDKSDRGVAILIDDRFTHIGYQKLYPPHWQNIKVITNSYDLKKELKEFYDEK